MVVAHPFSTKLSIHEPPSLLAPYVTVLLVRFCRWVSNHWWPASASWMVLHPPISTHRLSSCWRLLRESTHSSQDLLSRWNPSASMDENFINTVTTQQRNVNCEVPVCSTNAMEVKYCGYKWLDETKWNHYLLACSLQGLQLQCAL